MKRLGKLDVVTQSLSHMGDWEDHEIKGSLGYVVRHSFKTERINKRQGHTVTCKFRPPYLYIYVSFFKIYLLVCLSVCINL